MSFPQLIVITGASSGIGAETAKLFASSNPNYKVLLLARRTDRLQELFTSGQLSEENALAVTCDVTKKQDIIDALAQARSKFGDIPVELLVNNAGVMFLDTLADQEESKIETMVQTNIVGVLYAIKAVINEMLERKSGTIVNISSIAGRKAFPNHVAYCGTKFAVHGITEALRGEVAGSSVRVSTVAPGVTETELLSHNESKNVDPYVAWKKQEMNDEVLKSIDVAQTIKFVFEMPAHVCIREVMMAPTKQIN